MNTVAMLAPTLARGLVTGEASRLRVARLCPASRPGPFHGCRVGGTHPRTRGREWEVVLRADKVIE